MKAGTLYRDFCGLYASGRRQSELHQVIGLVGSLGELDMDIVVKLAPCNCPGNSGCSGSCQRRGNSPRTTFRGVISLPVKFVASVDDAISPVRNDIVDRTVCAALKLDAWCQKDPHELSLRAELMKLSDPIVSRMAIGLRVDLLFDQRVCESLGLLLKADSAVDARSGSAYSSRVGSHDLLANVDRWTVRVRGDGEVALADWDREEYWAGEFTLPLREVLRN